MVLENGRFSKTSNTTVLVDGDIKLHPKRFDNTYAHWLFVIGIFRHNGGDNKSAYFYGDGKEDFVVAENIEEL
jgi:valyl-tRNA synthetase